MLTQQYTDTHRHSPNKVCMAQVCCKHRYHTCMDGHTITGPALLHKGHRVNTHTHTPDPWSEECLLSLEWICVLNKDLPCFSVLVSLADNRAAQCTCQPKLPSNNCLLYQGGPEDVTVNSLSSLTQPFCIGRNGGRKRKWLLTILQF